ARDALLHGLAAIYAPEARRGEEHAGLVRLCHDVVEVGIAARAIHRPGAPAVLAQHHAPDLDAHYEPKGMGRIEHGGARPARAGRRDRHAPLREARRRAESGNLGPGGAAVAREEEPGRLGDGVERRQVAWGARHVPDLAVADSARLPRAAVVGRAKNAGRRAGHAASVRTR